MLLQKLTKMTHLNLTTFLNHSPSSLHWSYWPEKWINRICPVLIYHIKTKNGLFCGTFHHIYQTRCTFYLFLQGNSGKKYPKPPREGFGTKPAQRNTHIKKRVSALEFKSGLEFITKKCFFSINEKPSLTSIWTQNCLKRCFQAPALPSELSGLVFRLDLLRVSNNRKRW